MISKVAICNLALIEVGNITIQAITDDTREARACNGLWDVVRDDLLFSYPWKFALKRVSLGAALADEPEFEYDYQYTLPADCLRVLEVYEASEETWTVEGNVLLYSDTEPQIRYIAKIEDVAQYHEKFSKCFALALAAKLAVKLKNDTKLRVSLLQELDIEIARAYKLDAIEGDPAIRTYEQESCKGNYSWQKEGR
jgi:hypothetical protein